MKYSLLQGREREREGDIFREGKIQKERILLRGPMTEEHLSERSFLDLIQMREIGTKKSFSGKSPLIAKMLTFFYLCWSFSGAGSTKLENHRGVLSSKRSCNKR